MTPEEAQPNAARRRLGHLGLVLASTALSLLLAEAALRTLTPRYADAASGLHSRDPYRIWANTAHAVDSLAHPDTGVEHPVLYNNLALRQHRDLPRAKPAGGVRIGCFGDSFTENRRVRSPHAYTEVLDFLLNQRSPRFEVLNFGVSGYSTGQSYLFWRDAGRDLDLDLVVYAFCANDLRDLYEDGLFELDEGGVLRQSLARETPAWRRLLGRLHLTYLVLDAWTRLRGEAGADPTPEREAVWRRAREQRLARHADANVRALRRAERTGNRTALSEHYATLFRHLLVRWRDEVEAAGSEFVVVVAPCRSGPGYEELFRGFEVIDLLALLRSPEYAGLRWTFERDGHWNELGNQIAGIQLAHDLGLRLGLPEASSDEVERALFRYYSAFAPGWMPSHFVLPSPLIEADLQAIRERYVPLEKQLGPGR